MGGEKNCIARPPHSTDPSLTLGMTLALGMTLTLVCASGYAQSPFRWGGDAEGGAPYVEADPQNPEVVRGFDVEVAAEIARGRGREPRFVQVGFANIDQSVERGDFEIGMSGVEDTPARRAAHAVTIPYFEFREVLTVRQDDVNRFRTLSDLRGRRVSTLGATIAYDILMANRDRYDLKVVSYDDDVHPYEDVVNGRADAVLLDHIIAARATGRTPGLVTQPEPIATAYYVGVLAKKNTALRDRINEILKARMRDGTLERIYRKWDIWDDSQQLFFNRVLQETRRHGDTATRRTEDEIAASPRPRVAASVVRYIPALLQAAVITIVLSCTAMALAILFGILIASGRVYGRPVARMILLAYVEVIRGTPLLLQLFVLYYGLAAVIRLPAFVAALIGLGLNYAAYESEIYRGALEAVPKGQLEAARTLGLSEFKVFRLVRAPQAFRFALAPMTNDFVAMLKDSSLVSVITVVELTKQTSILAVNIGSWVIPGAICAALYLAMSLPLAELARRLERRWRMS